MIHSIDLIGDFNDAQPLREPAPRRVTVAKDNFSIVHDKILFHYYCFHYHFSCAGRRSSSQVSAEESWLTRYLYALAILSGSNRTLGFSAHSLPRSRLRSVNTPPSIMLYANRQSCNRMKKTLNDVHGRHGFPAFQTPCSNSGSSSSTRTWSR